MENRSSILKILSVAILGTVVLICTNGLTFSGITVFDEAILNEFGWTKSELKFRDFVNLVCAAVIMPFVGIIIDRYGVKRTMVIGLLMIAGLYYTYAYIQAAWQMYAIHFGFAIAVSGAGTLAVIIMVSQRVKERRGMAIGIALAGTSAGGIIIPPIGTRLLEAYGWRTSFQIEAMIPLIVMVIILLFLTSMKYNTASAKEQDTGLNELKFKEAIHTPVFWAICFAGVFCFYSIMGIIGNLFLYLRELGFSVTAASNAFSLFFLIILSAKLASGWVTDYINQYVLFKIQLSLMLIGTIGVAMNTAAFVWPSLIAIGLGWGGLYTLFNYIIITTFGVKSAGKIGGVISTFESIGAGLGVWLTGLISDRTGSYSMSFWLVVVLLLIALAISFLIKPVKGDKELETAA